ncbi:MAG TPA: protein phosphatase CheZ [Smithellaceae bacterium]|nr:protein phosphatase CheZ [Smithellaceae bacterium]
MPAKDKNITAQCQELLNSLDLNQQAETAAQLFLEYCVYQDQCEHTKRLAPLINTVAEALTKNVGSEDSLKFGVKAVQMYLRMPPVEYFGETLSRLGYLDRESVEEMIRIQPKNVIFGAFLLEQGVISREQRDMAVIAQKRLFNIHEVYARLQKDDESETVADVIDHLKGVFQHFTTSTAELEDDLKKSKTENIHDTLQRLENIVGETEKQSDFVLGIVDQIFTLKNEIQICTEEIKRQMDPSNQAAAEAVKNVSEKLDQLFSLNIELNSSQQFQDRIGQQMLKIIPSIQAFHDQLMKIAGRLNLDWKNIETKETGLTKVGYGGAEAGARSQQSDVDDLLASLGL